MKLLWTFLLCGAFSIIGAQSFTGTWKLEVSKAKFSAKPATFELANGMYKCFDCDPPYTVKADGSDQPVTGQPGYDTASVRITDDRTIRVVGKKAGKVAFELKQTVAADGNAR